MPQSWMSDYARLLKTGVAIGGGLFLTGIIGQLIIGALRIDHEIFVSIVFPAFCIAGIIVGVLTLLIFGLLLPLFK